VGKCGSSQWQRLKYSQKRCPAAMIPYFENDGRKFFRPHLKKHGIPYVSPTWTFSFDKVRDFAGTFCNIMTFCMQHAFSKQFLKRLYCLAETDRLRILSNHRTGFYWLTVFLCTPFFFFCNTRNENWAMKRTSCTSEYLSIKQPLQCLPKSEI